MANLMVNKSSKKQKIRAPRKSFGHATPEVIKEGLDEKGRFRPGHRITVGNVSRHRDFITRTLIYKLHQAVDPKNPRSQTVIEGLVDKLIEVAMSGNVHAFVAICDQVQGRPKTQINIGGFEGYSAIRIETVLVEKVNGKVIEHEPTGTDTAGGAETEIHFEDADRSNNETTS